MKLAALLAVVYIALAVAANWLASRFTVSVGFGYLAPAGVWAIGAVLVLRDWIQQLVGTWRSVVLVPIAGLLSWGVGDAAGWTSLEKIAVASVVAFTVSETVEAAVFAPLRKKRPAAGVALSATIGNALDSYIFLALAFGSQAFFAGNFIGKLEAIGVGVAATAARRRALPVAA